MRRLVKKETPAAVAFLMLRVSVFFSGRPTLKAWIKTLLLPPSKPLAAALPTSERWGTHAWTAWCSCCPTETVSLYVFLRPLPLHSYAAAGSKSRLGKPGLPQKFQYRRFLSFSQLRVHSESISSVFPKWTEKPVRDGDWGWKLLGAKPSDQANTDQQPEYTAGFRVCPPTELVVAESVVVIKKLLQMQPEKHSDIIKHMAKLTDNIQVRFSFTPPAVFAGTKCGHLLPNCVQVPMARASILWLIGEYCEHVPKIAPDVLRKMAKSFTNEEDIVKLQIINLAAKLYLTNSKQARWWNNYYSKRSL